MAELKPLGSEKLKGDDKLNRILELTYYNPDKQTQKSVDAEYISESKNGVYGIVKEKDGYYVKKGLTESTLDYIGGMFMKNKNRFSSYNEAFKRLDLLKGQETLQEDTRYVLKVNKGNKAPVSDTPPASADESVPSFPAMGNEPPANMPSPEETPDMGAETPPEDMGGETEDDFGSDFLKGIQKLTGKLGEKLRDHQEDMKSDDLKYVVNSVLSAIDLDKMDDKDKEDIISTIENEDMGEDGLGGSDETTEPEMPSDMGAPVPSGNESELGEINALDELINTPFDFNDDEDKPYQDMEEIDTTSDEYKSMTNDKNYFGAMNNMDDVEPEFTPPDSNDVDTEEEFSDDEDDENPVIDNPEDDEETDGEICTDCHGTGMLRGKECPTCHGEGVVFQDENLPDELDTKYMDAEDLYDEDPGYDPIEMGEENLSDTQTKEIELDELTDMIHNTVKETLGKYFK